MKKTKICALFLAAAMLLPGCAARASTESTQSEETGANEEIINETVIQLSDEGVTVHGQPASTDSSAPVYVGAEIIYYHDGTDSSYGEGTGAEKHSAEEAAAHTVVTITQPGAYRISGTLSKGQIAVDLGKKSKSDPEAVVTLILDNADVTCTVAPALIFYNVYECDQAFVAYGDGENENYTPTAEVDTAAAGANVILAAGSVNSFTGSHVARIYKEGTTKKLHKYDAAFYSKRSMNISAETFPGMDEADVGKLNIVADNEGLDSELHLTINGGCITIVSQDDGINTNEDYVSVTTINGGTLTIDAGNGSEGDGIDSNGYLVINGGTLWSTAHPAADGGIDADSPIQINGGTVSAFGGRNDAADKSSKQPYMELSFASRLSAGTLIELKDDAGSLVWSAVLTRECQSVTLATPELKLNKVYHLYVNGVLQCWNGNSFGMMGGMMGPGGFQRPDGRQPMDGQQPPQIPDGWQPMESQEPPQMEGQPGGFDPTQGDKRPDFKGDRTEGFDRGERPEGFDPANQPGGFDFSKFGGFGGMGSQADGSGSVDFVLTETVRSFSGICDSDASGKTRVSFAVEGAVQVGRSTVLSAVTAVTPSVELDGAAVQITVTDDPSENYSASCYLSEGLEAVNALLPADEGDYLLTVAVAAEDETYTGATQISFTVGVLPFTDVKETDESYAAIKALYDKKIMVGTGGSKFSPDMTVTRAQAVMTLANLSGAESMDSDLFSDVPKGIWYGGVVGWAAENGIVVGDGQGHFYPDMIVTAEHMRIMLDKWSGGSYTDTTGYTGELTRAQLARMLMDVMD